MALSLLSLYDLIYEMLGMSGEVDPRSSLGGRTRPNVRWAVDEAGDAKKRKMQCGTNGSRGECHGISCQDIEAKQSQAPGKTHGWVGADWAAGHGELSGVVLHDEEDKQPKVVR